MEISMEISMESNRQPLNGEPSMKKQLLALATMASALQEAGAVRHEHNTKWQELRIAIDQAADQADEPAPADPLQELVDGVKALREAAGV
jgi:hypothetical protein